MNEQIEIFETINQTQVEVKYENNTFWLSLNQISELFCKDKSVISRHLKNIFESEELVKDSTVAFFATVQNESNRVVSRQIEYFNLDAIISVGYRINSKQGTQFRIWATNRLKEYLIEGQAINQKRLDELGKAIQLIEQSAKNELNKNEAKGLLDILTNYTKSFIILNQYDSHNLSNDDLTENITYEIQYEEAIQAIKELKNQLITKKEATELFGNEKDESFKSSLGSIVQSFGGQYLYASIEEQAANLLYFVIKNHSFSDGNKRIGAFLFIWFLEQNKHRFKKTGELKINDNALVAIALLVAQSQASEKELMISLIINLIKD